MGHVVQTNGDYTIKTKDSGTILLDTGDNVGRVRVTGNLVVSGDTLTVAAENLNVKDNIIELNVEDPGPGVTLGYSGIQINRGSLTPASLVLDDTNVNDPTWIFALGTPGSYSYNSSSIRLRSIKTDPNTDDGDLTIDFFNKGVLKITGVADYHLKISDINDIPNKKYVDDSIINNPSFQSIADDTRLAVVDKDITPGDPGSPSFFQAITTISTSNRSAINLIIDANLNSQFYENRIFILGGLGSGGLEFDGQNFEIRTEATSPQNQDIFVKTNAGDPLGTGKLRTNYAIQVDHISANPAYVVNSTVIYGKSPSIGTTGLFFTNSTNSAEELISKNRALLFSMLF
jgi:hypothetical protein